MKTIHIAKYQDRMYPEDNELFGAYHDPKKAQERIELECASWSKEPSRHLAQISYYSVEKVEVLDEPLAKD